MKVTLKKAHSLELAVRDLIEDIEIERNTKLCEFESTNKLDVLRKENRLKLARKVTLVELKFKIRSLIGKANEQTGLNNILTEISSISTIIRFNENYIEYLPEKAVDREVLAGKLDKFRAAENTDGSSNSVTTSVDSKEEAQDIIADIAKLKLVRNDLTDKVAGINLTHLIDFSDDMVVLLREEKLIA